MVTRGGIMHCRTFTFSRGFMARPPAGHLRPAYTTQLNQFAFFKSSTIDDSLRAKDVLPRVDARFENAALAVYRNKMVGELLRAITVFILCSSHWLVKRNQELLKLSRKVLGRRLHQWLMNRTFYGHFVIGQDERVVSPIIRRYMLDGVNPILYFALEEDKSTDGNPRLSNDPFYAANVQKFKEAIEITGSSTCGSGYIAVKPTALCAPSLWSRLTELINGRLADTASREDYHRLSDVLANPEGLSEAEREELRKLVSRAEDVIQSAMERGVGVMIDAEQTYFQPAIQRILGVGMMERFNKDQVHVVTTYQTYLKGGDVNIIRDMDYCRRNGVAFGARIVRGAYLDQERTIAKLNGVEDPTNPTFEATTAVYHSAAEAVLREISDRPKGHVEVMFGTHNEETLKYLLGRLAEHNPPLSSVSFGQLYGMCDHITFHLGQAGFPTYKSMPFGPIELVTSYLGRRAIENRGVLEKVKKEKRLLRREMFQRCTGYRR